MSMDGAHKRLRALLGLVTAAIVAAVVVSLAIRASTSPPTATPDPTPLATGSATSSPDPVTAAPATTPDATQTPAAPAITVTVRSVKIPNERRYFVTGFRRLLVLDLASKSAAELGSVTVDQGLGDAIDLSESSDGRSVLLTVVQAEGQGAVFLIKPELGEARELYRGGLAGAARISPDGRMFAVSRVSRDQTEHGIWVGAVEAGLSRRVVADGPARAETPSLPLQFSADGQRLAVSVTPRPGNARLFLVTTDAEARYVPDLGTLRGGQTQEIGPGAFVEGLDRGRPLVIASSSTPFGGQSLVYRTAPDGSSPRDLYRPGTQEAITALALRPDGGRIALVQQAILMPHPSTPAVVLLDGGGAVLKRTDHAFLVDLWWSRDGTKLFGAFGGDDSTGSVAELISGAFVMNYCQRGGDRPPCT